MDTSADPAASSVIGVAVLYRGDDWALDISLRALRNLPLAPASIVVAEDPDGLRPLTPRRRPDVDAWIPFRPGRSPRAEAIASLRACHIVAIVPEGTALGPCALSDEARRFSARPSLRASLMLADLILEIGDGPDQDLADPFAVLKAKGRRAPRRAPLYFSPCVLTIAPARGPVALERFARRSDWAAAHLLMSAGINPASCLRGRSSEIGHIRRLVGQEAARSEGREACRALSRLRDAHPGCADIARRDARRLVWEQITGLIRVSSPAARIRFLAGMVDAHSEDRATRRRLARDIADLA